MTRKPKELESPKQLAMTLEELAAFPRKPAREEITERVTYWRELARRLKAREEGNAIEEVEESDEQRMEKFVAHIRDLLDQPLGLTGAAGQVLKRLDAIQDRLAAFDAAERSDVVEAMCEALRGWTDVRFLVMCVCETEIRVRQQMLEGASDGGERRARKYAARDREMVEEFQRRRSLPKNRRKSDTALMQEIGKAKALGRRRSSEIISSGLRAGRRPTTG